MKTPPLPSWKRLTADYVYSSTDNIQPFEIINVETIQNMCAMNNIVTSKRNALTTGHISSLVFINCIGPPIQLFKPDHYVESWIKSGKRNSDEVNCPKRTSKNEDSSYVNLWTLFNN
ncbi:hypothetical protein QTP88_023224 [Uroleucon formosanum]